MLVRDLHNNSDSSVTIVVDGWYNRDTKTARAGFAKVISEGCNEELLDMEVDRFFIRLDPQTMQVYLAVYVKGEFE